MYFVEKVFEDAIEDISQFPSDFCKQGSVFFDIETSGLSPKNSQIFLIGILFFRNDKLIFRQYFANHKDEEIVILRNFIEDISSFDTSYHFNGLSFDSPFSNQRLLHHGLNFQIDKKSSVDIFQIIKSNKNLLNLESIKLKSIEEYLGIFRKDDLSGKEVAALYKVFIHSPNSTLRDKLLLHNEEDVLNLYNLLPILKMLSAPEPKKDFIQIEILNIELLDDKVVVDGFLKLECNSRINIELNGVKGLWDPSSNHFKIEFDIKCNILYYTFKDSKHYFYIPQLDQAVHKSAAKYYKFNDKVPANSSNCYSKQLAQYIELPEAIYNKDVKICSIHPGQQPNCLIVSDIQKHIDSPEIVELFKTVVSNILCESN